MARLAAVAACWLAVVGVSSCPLQVEMETWTQLPHSYAIVGLALARELAVLLGDKCVQVVEAPAYRGRLAQWRRDSSSGSSGGAAGKPQGCPDVIVRAAFPLRMRKREACPSARVVVLGTTEFGVAPLSLFQDAEAEAAAGGLTGCSLALSGPCTVPVAWSQVGPGVGVAAPSHWAAAGFAKAGLRADQLLVLPHGVDPALWAAPGDAARAAGAAAWPSVAAFVRARQWPRALGSSAAVVVREGSTAGPLGDVSTLDPACVWVASVGSGTMNKGLDMLLAAAANAALRVAPLGGCVRLLFKGLDGLYASHALLQQWVDGAGPGLRRAAAASTSSGRRPDSAGGAEQRGEPALQVWSVGKEVGTGAMAALLAGADLYAAPFRGEGFALPVLEAAAAGTPVVATAGGAADDYMSDSWAIRVPSRAVGVTFGGEVGSGLAPDADALANAIMWTSLAKAGEAGRLGQECAVAVAAAAAERAGEARSAQPGWITSRPGRASCGQVASVAAWLASASPAGRAAAREWSWARAAAELLAAVESGAFPPARHEPESSFSREDGAIAPLAGREMAAVGAVWRGQGTDEVRAVSAGSGDDVTVTVRLCGVSATSTVMLAMVGATGHGREAGGGNGRVKDVAGSPSDAPVRAARGDVLVQRRIVGRWQVERVWSSAKQLQRTGGGGCLDAEVSWTARLGHLGAVLLGPEAPLGAQLCEVRHGQPQAGCDGVGNSGLRELWFAVGVEGSATQPANERRGAALGERVSAWLEASSRADDLGALHASLSLAIGRFASLLAVRARVEAPAVRAVSSKSHVGGSRRPEWVSISDAATSLWMGGDEAGAMALSAQAVRGRATSQTTRRLSELATHSALSGSRSLGRAWECGWVAPVPQPIGDWGKSGSLQLLRQCGDGGGAHGANSSESQDRIHQMLAEIPAGEPDPWTEPGGSRLFDPSPYLWYRSGAAAVDAFEAGAVRLAARVERVLGVPRPLPPASRTVVIVSETLCLHSVGKALSRVLAAAATRWRGRGWSVLLLMRHSNDRIGWPASPGDAADAATASCLAAGVWTGLCAAGVAVEVSAPLPMADSASSEAPASGSETVRPGLRATAGMGPGGRVSAQFEHDLRWAAARLGAVQPSVVVFTDLGMEAWSTALALRRSAPVQVALPGGPWMPRKGGAAQVDVVYSTRFHVTPYHGAVPPPVEVMAGSGFAPFVPVMPAVSRPETRLRLIQAAVDAGMLPPAAVHAEREAADGRRGGGTHGPGSGALTRPFLLFVPHTQPKLSLPSLLGLLRALASRPQGIALLLDGTGDGWSPVTAARFGRVAASPLLAAAERRSLGAAAARVGFLPRLKAQAYAAMLSAADAVWDTWPYSGVSTTVEAAAAGVPLFDAASTLQAAPLLCTARQSREQEAPLADAVTLRTVHGCELYRAAANGSLFDPEPAAAFLVASMLRLLA